MTAPAPRTAIVTGSESGIGRATAVDGGMLEMGPMAGSHPT